MGGWGEGSPAFFLCLEAHPTFFLSLSNQDKRDSPSRSPWGGGRLGGEVGPRAALTGGWGTHGGLWRLV